MRSRERRQRGMAEIPQEASGEQAADAVQRSSMIGRVLQQVPRGPGKDEGLT